MWAEVKRVFRAEMTARGLFPADVAPWMGISERELERRLEPNRSKKQLQIADVALLCDDVEVPGPVAELAGAVLTRILGARGLVVIGVPVVVDVDGDVLAHHAAASRAVHERLHASRDRHISPSEGAALEQAARAELEAAAGAMLLGRRAQEERGGLSLKGRGH